VARSTTTRRSTYRRTGYPNRSGVRHLPVDDAIPTASGGGPAGNGAALPTVTTASDQKAQAMSDEYDPWVALPEAERQRLGRHFSRLLLLAVRSTASGPSEETCR
jgi:hypothetical protein